MTKRPSSPERQHNSEWQTKHKHNEAGEIGGVYIDALPDTG